MNWDDLPSSWETVELLEISKLVRGVTYSRGDATYLPKEDNIPVLRANNIKSFGISFEDLVYVPLRLVSNEQKIISGDVVIATSSGSISVVGKAAIAKKDLNAGFGAFCGLLRPIKAINSLYFGLFFSSSIYRNYVASVAQGVNINNLKREHFENISLPLPPLLEQKRIADKLERVLSRVDAARQRLERVPTLLKRFRASVLEQAVSGELTREWRDGIDDSLEVKRVEIGEIIRDLRNGIAEKPKDSPPGVPTLKISSVRPFEVSVVENRFSDLNENSKKLYNLEIGDLLVTRYNGSMEFLGVCGRILSGELTRYTYPDKLMRLRVDSEKCISAYLEIVVNSPDSRNYIESIAKTSAGQTGISGKDLKKLSFNLPPLLEQTEIIRRVEHLFKLADQLEGRYLAAKTHLERLTPALLAKAFRGELVEQDPTDEPASILLERIRAERAAVPAKKSASGPKPRAVKTPTDPVTGEASKKRGRPAKTGETLPQTSLPQAMLREIPLAHDFEAAVKLLETRKLEREAVGTVQGSLFDLGE